MKISIPLQNIEKNVGEGKRLAVLIYFIQFGGTNQNWVFKNFILSMVAKLLFLSWGA